MMRKGWFSAAMILLLTGSMAASEQQVYKHFKVTVFIPVQVVERMGHDPAWMASSWKTTIHRTGA